MNKLTLVRVIKQGTKSSMFCFGMANESEIPKKLK